MSLSVVCWKWHGKTMGDSRPDYGPRHVNTLAAMVRRNLSIDHEIVCVTDDPEGIDPSIRIVPLWPDLREKGRCFVRLKAFMPEMREILGERVLSLDLDTVVTGPLDPLVDRPEPFVIWSDPSRITPYCGSQWLVTPGVFPEVFTEFSMAEHATLKPRFGYFGSDQAWLAHKLPGAPVWTRADGVWSFRMHLLRNKGRDPTGVRFRRKVRVMNVAALPEGARVVHFHGAYDPSQLMIQEMVPWVREHWRI